MSRRSRRNRHRPPTPAHFWENTPGRTYVAGIDPVLGFTTYRIGSDGYEVNVMRIPNYDLTANGDSTSLTIRDEVGNPGEYAWELTRPTTPSVGTNNAPYITGTGAGLFEQIDPHNYAPYIPNPFWTAESLRETFTQLANDRPAPTRNVTIMTGEAGMNQFQQLVSTEPLRFSERVALQKLTELNYRVDKVSLPMESVSSRCEFVYKLYHENSFVADFTSEQFKEFVKTLIGSKY